MDLFQKASIKLLNLDGVLMRNGCLQMLLNSLKDQNVQFISINQEWILKLKPGAQHMDLNLDFWWLMTNQFPFLIIILLNKEIKWFIDQHAITHITQLKKLLHLQWKALGQDNPQEIGKLLLKSK